MDFLDEVLGGELPVFPLPGAILFPGAILPLNIFEPRYVRMIEDALKSGGVIGMIQPSEDGGEVGTDAGKPGLAQVGCAGVIARCNRTEDGRFEIALAGLKRFRVKRELPSDAPYRLVEADFHPFDADVAAEPHFSPETHERLLDALGDYADSLSLGIKREELEAAPTPSLVDALSAQCPFSNVEKQLLLEAPGHPERLSILLELFDFHQSARRSRIQ